VIAFIIIVLYKLFFSLLEPLIKTQELRSEFFWVAIRVPITFSTSLDSRASVQTIIRPSRSAYYIGRGGQETEPK